MKTSQSSIQGTSILYWRIYYVGSLIIWSSALGARFRYLGSLIVVGSITLKAKTMFFQLQWLDISKGCLFCHLYCLCWKFMCRICQGILFCFVFASWRSYLSGWSVLIVVNIGNLLLVIVPAVFFLSSFPILFVFSTSNSLSWKWISWHYARLGAFVWCACQLIWLIRWLQILRCGWWP